MKSFISLLGLTFITSLHAATVTTTVLEVDRDEKTFIRLATGEVLWTDGRDLALIDALDAAAKSHRPLTIDFRSDDHTLLAATQTDEAPLKDSLEFNEKDNDGEPPYYPTVFTSMAQLQAAHDSMDNNTHDDSQCYNRAHGWAFDLYQTRGIRSMKMFLFFSKRYIREFEHKWWFHVAPMAYLQDQYGTNEYVMDRSFSISPVYTQVWTNIFLKNRPVCKSVSRWQDYDKYDPNEYCHLIRATMYYRGTVALRKRDENEKYRSKFSEKEVREARQQAFIYADRYDP